MDITEPSRKGAAHPTTSKSARGVSLSINQAPNAIRQLIHRWLTDKEADKNLLRFQEACIPNRQLFWSGMHREEAQKWADSHGLQTLTTALGPLLYHGDPSPQTQAPTRFIHGASIIFAWFVSQGDLVTVLSHPPPQFFHPSGQTFYQLYEEPIIKGKLGNRPVTVIHTAHPAVEAAIHFIYQIWPCDISWFWTKIFGIPDIEFDTTPILTSQKLRPNFSSAPLLTSKRPESKDPANKSVTDTKNKITKGGQQKTKKNKKKVSGTVADQGKNPMPKKSLKSGTSSNKQQLVKTAVISKKQNVETGIKKKSKKKKRKEQKLAIEQAQAQPNAKQGQKKLATMAKAKGSKTGAKVKATTKSVIKNGK
ncbi:uncharacterized protein FFB20_07079 [Fusarium fujikuroi]|uniref:Uncharacterized protein n=1 Tax=Gibberella fujikuroi (strain CBS 195.34 / IMI 58289 / NRRL A-6831) TaxID=1279085 RepID=S0EPI8_GIBF5|nr:uncharacterized protein FFUJ_11235 [Fusarium fujikuroi IMI 58289]KLO81623.1 uncharacterized protein LW93_6774 [Fusarium fujikuroi]KLP02449.1 uncharacterized protein Y057_1230 [Fusarium fujikuroi]CCT75193.1 uncharacterized protein FFUJ_11235 [Fusarium fujikuroi IMI 58289]SCN83913.1 uncharacterized protein FFB20_07079 [Fusarium fujikuroi]SCO16718.1 uncharacterized protein FFC1_12942 [Fusarium fujikuroi]